MVIDPSTARREWKVGRIECTYPGSDQLVRVVDVQVRDKFLKRSVTRISCWNSQKLIKTYEL